VGETAVDTRRELEETREELDGTIAELRNRGEQARETVRRRAPLVAAGVVVVAGGAVATVLVVRSRRRSGVVPTVARTVRSRRDELVELVAARVAEQQARAERRANPLWRRTAAKALETAATVGVAALVRNLVSRPRA
jgi:hypothetical protein